MARLLNGNKGVVTRRDVMAGAGRAITLAAFAAGVGTIFPKSLRAQLPEMPHRRSDKIASPCMTILYPRGKDTHWDADYVRDHHMKLIAEIYGDSASRIEIRKAKAAAEGATPAPYFGAANVWIADLKKFEENTLKHGLKLIGDMKHFTNTDPIVQYDSVVDTEGAPRDAMKVGDACLTIVYPNGKDVHWDVDYYRQHHMPLIMKLYGKDAIKRIELRKGQHGLEMHKKPHFIGAVNIYINDQAAFDAAGAKHGQTLVKDVPNFSSVNPTAFPTTIFGVTSA